MMLKVHVEGAHSYDVGDEIWQEPLADAIRAEAEIIADDAGSALFAVPDETIHEALRDRIIDEMKRELVQVGDTYWAPDGVLYSLIDEPALDEWPSEARLRSVSSASPAPIVEEILRFEDLPLGSVGTRRAVVRWSDGTQSEALK